MSRMKNFKKNHSFALLTVTRSIVREDKFIILQQLRYNEKEHN